MPRKWLIVVVALLPLAGCASAAAVPAPSRAKPLAVEVAAIPAGWQSALTGGQLPHAAHEQLIAYAGTPDGKSVVAESYTPGGPHTIVDITVGSWTRRVIHTCTAAEDQVLAATADDRYVAYVIVPPHSSPGFQAWTLWLWDATTGKSTKIAHTTATADGPMNQPLLSGGRLFWSQGNADGTVDVRAYTTATAQRSVVRHGHPGAPFALGADVAWMEDGRLDEVDAALRPVTPTVPLSGAAFVGTAGDTVAWANADLTAISVWQPGWAVPWRAVTGENLQWVRVAGPLVTWDDGDAQYALDTRTGRYVQLTPAAGATLGWSGTLAVEYPPATKRARAPLETSIVDAAALTPLEG